MSLFLSQLAWLECLCLSFAVELSVVFSFALYGRFFRVLMVGVRFDSIHPAVCKIILCFDESIIIIAVL